MTQFSQKLSNLQLELLKLYDKDVSDEDLKNIHQLLSDYFAKKTIIAANKVWDEEKWDDSKINELLTSHLRTPYAKK